MQPSTIKQPCLTQTVEFLSKLLPCVLIIFLSSGCARGRSAAPGFTYVAPRGIRPNAETIAWSPTNEQQLLVAAYETPIEPTEIYILDPSTGQKQSLVSQPSSANLLDAKWSPDGSHVLILSGGDTMRFEKAGWWELDLAGTGRKYALPYGDIAWSPDGQTVAQLRSLKNDNGTREVDFVLMNSKTAAERKVAAFEGMVGTLGLSWSPDGQSVVFAMGPEGKIGGDLYRWDRQTDQIVKLTDTGTSEFPAWSPKGNVIAFRITLSTIHLISPDGKCELSVPALEKAKSPTWSPDGHKLAYIALDGIYYLELDKVFGRDIYQSLCP